MSTFENTGPCPHARPNDDMLVARAGFADDELASLTIMRYFFCGFAVPQSQSWMSAFRTASDNFPEDSAPHVTLAALNVVQTMRMSRPSGFRFSNPDCPSCARLLTEEERQLMCLLRTTRQSRQSEQYMHAMLLCEGNEIRPTMAAMVALVELLDHLRTKKDQGIPVTPVETDGLAEPTPRTALN